MHDSKNCVPSCRVEVPDLPDARISATPKMTCSKEKFSQCPIDNGLRGNLKTEKHLPLLQNRLHLPAILQE